ncbi:MAG: hypothetical protein C0602_01325 [Denitrovibrio sp.]|nr:MAG: hypothetical protein C0602_01325 [Denitrovibrio sp.]
MVNSKIIEYIADASIIIIALIWGSTFIVVKQGVETFEPITFLFCRFFIAALLMLLISIPFFKKISRRLIRDGIILGLYLFLTFLFQTLALELSSATEVGVLTGVYVLFVPVLSAIFFKKTPHLFSVIGVLISASGMLMVTYAPGMGITYGQFLAVLNAFFIGLYILQVDVYSRKHNVVVLTMVQLVTTAFMSGLYALFFESQSIAEVARPEILYPIIYLAVFATVVCFFVQTAMQKYTTPTKAAIMFTIEPLSSAFFSYFLGGEVLGTRQYSGAALIILAILVAEVGTAVKHSKKPAQPL